MSAGVARLGDTSTGHAAFPPTVSDLASTNVMVNGIGVVRVGDHWAVHCDPVSCHDALQAVGSSTVFVNGKPIARIGDALSCGDSVVTGSSNVFSG